MKTHNRNLNILEMRVDVTSYDKAVNQVIRWSKDNRGRYVCIANVHMCMESFDHLGFRKIVNNSDLVIPDGKPLVWAQRLLGHRNAAHVRNLEKDGGPHVAAH